jgi:curved DNA-binding protein CbpA
VDDPNYYELLGVTFAASPEEIRRAYRSAMKEIHPDRQRAAGRARAEEQAKLLNRAYATLSKPESRRRYDQTIRAQVMQDQIMSRYVGGFVEQWQERDGEQFRRAPTAADRREQAQANRSALISLLTAFVVLTVVVLGLVLLFALGEALVSAVF